MRHKYETRGIVLSRMPLGEANTLVTLLTPSFGIVRARAQGLRKPSAKLAAALTTLTESELTLVRGKEGWRVVGAVLTENWFGQLPNHESRTRAARVTGLVLRLVVGELHEQEIFSIMQGFFRALAQLSEAEQEGAELLAVLRVLAALGLDVGGTPGEPSLFSSVLLASIEGERADYVTRINHGIAASGL